MATAAGGRVKQEEAGKPRGRVIRVADPVREGRLLVLQQPPPLFSVPVTPTSESPAATRRRAARRAGSISGRQSSSPATLRAASDGQMVPEREPSRSRIEASSRLSVAETLCLRHASLQ